jgi:hypothetical protein
MSEHRDLFTFLNRGIIENELLSVYETLSEFQKDFYQNLFLIPKMNIDHLPLVLKTPGGYRDKFSLDINYHFYPWLFFDLFTKIGKKKLYTLCIIAQLFAEALVQIDKVIDNQVKKYSDVMKTIIILSSQYKLSSATRYLAQMFDSKSLFWNRFEQFYREYIRQVLEEKTDKCLDPPTIKKMEESAIGKVSLTKIITAAMAELSEKTSILPNLEKSQDLFFIGYQLYDDVKDWRRDYENGQYSYVLKKFFHKFNLAGDISAGHKIGTEDLGRRIHLSNILQDTLSMSAYYLERSEKSLDKIQCPKWIAWLQMQKQNILNLREDLIEIRDSAIERARAKFVSSSNKQQTIIGTIKRKHSIIALNKGVSFLQQQQKKNYLEAKHLEMLSRRFTPNSNSLCVWGTVFQRAVTLNTLVKARAAGFKLDDRTFVHDVQRLIDSRVYNRKGGWSYFPQLNDLPPDCDDLAEVLQVLVALHHPETSNLCEEPILLAINMQRDDGGIGTWIADPLDHTSLKAQSNMHSIWGSEPDLEVMANFLYALSCYDSDRFRNNIEKGALYIADKQNEDGSWTSTWYQGPYYGTWICCRLLGTLKNYAKYIDKAIKFIIDTQIDNGSWDKDSGAVLNTAYALMTLSKHGGEKSLSHIKKAIRHILESQKQTGNWIGSTFIKMNSATRSFTSMPGFQQQFYKSDTMSTAFAIRSVLTGIEFIS